MTNGKTYNKSPLRINHKATKSKTNTGTTALERSVEQTTGKFKKPVSEFFGLTEACQRRGLGDFELKLFSLSKLSKESYAIQTQFQWNTERDPLTSDSDQNEFNGKEINTDGDRTVDTL